MTSLTLGVFDTIASIFKTLAERLKLPSILSGVIIAIVGLAFVILARRVTRAVRKTDSVEDDDKVMIVLKAIGLVLMFVALMVFIFTK